MVNLIKILSITFKKEQENVGNASKINVLL